MTDFEHHAWLFPGQGAQEIGMGRALLDKFPPARKILQIAEELSGFPLGSIILRGPDSQLVQTAVLQPALVAVSVGFIELLKQSGTLPLAVAGHSLGELSALYAAGVISQYDALRLASERGRLMSQAAQGGMLAVKDVAPQTLEQLLTQIEGTAVLANYNAPTQTVVSGQQSALDALIPLVSQAGGSSVRLNVSGAWHSPLVEDAGMQFQAVLQSVEFNAPSVPLVMGATGQVAQSADTIRQIMMQQIVSPVRWTTVTETLLALGCDRFLEVGPGKVLRGLLRKNVAAGIQYSVAGIDNSKAISELLTAVAQES